MSPRYRREVGSLSADQAGRWSPARGTDGTTPQGYDRRPWDRGRSPGVPGAREEMVVMMFWYGGGWPFWEVSLMWVGMIAFWGLVIWALYALITSATRRSSPRPGDGQRRGDDARRILDERLARGEIDTEEYQRLHDA